MAKYNKYFVSYFVPQQEASIVYPAKSLKTVPSKIPNKLFPAIASEAGVWENAALVTAKGNTGEQKRAAGTAGLSLGHVKL